MKAGGDRAPLASVLPGLKPRPPFWFLSSVSCLLSSVFALAAGYFCNSPTLACPESAALFTTRAPAAGSHDAMHHWASQ